MNLSELKPVPVLAGVDQNSIVFELRPFDLNAIVWANSFYGTETVDGLSMMNAILSNPDDFETYSNAVVDICYHLAVDLEDSGILTPCELKAKIRDAKGGPEMSIAQLHEALRIIFADSFTAAKEEPQKDDSQNGEIYKRMMERRKKQQAEVPTNWAKIYADFYREGGISLDDFFKLTMKQVDAIYSEISKAKHRELVNLAALHGAKVTGGTNTSQEKPKSEFTEADIDKIQKAQEKLIQEIAGHADKKNS